MLEKIGKYEIRLQIGRGAMGVVYEAYDTLIERRVALKTLRTDQLEASQLPDLVARFRREAQAVGRLSHPHIVTIHDYGVEDGTPYLVMEYISGRELAHDLQRRARFPLEDVVRIMTQMLGALGHAHDHGVVHRDLKPANMFLLEDGSLKVVDFGIARIDDSDFTALTSNGAVLGTPAYMSPEQVDGLPVDHRSDLFSAGVILYELLVGERPFTGESVHTVKQKVRSQEPLRPSEANPTLSPAWDKVLARALAKKPSARYETARQFAEAIKAAHQAERAHGEESRLKAAEANEHSLRAAEERSRAEALRRAEEERREAELAAKAEAQARRAAEESARREAELRIRAEAKAKAVPSSPPPAPAAPASTRSRLPAIAAAIVVVVLAFGGYYYIRQSAVGDSAKADAARLVAETRAREETEKRTKAETLAREEAERRARLESDVATKEADGKLAAELVARTRAEGDARKLADEKAKVPALKTAEVTAKKEAEARRQAEVDARRKADELAKQQAEAEARSKAETLAKRQMEEKAVLDKARESMAAEKAVQVAREKAEQAAYERHARGYDGFWTGTLSRSSLSDSRASIGDAAPILLDVVMSVKDQFATLQRSNRDVVEELTGRISSSRNSLSGDISLNGRGYWRNEPSKAWTYSFAGTFVGDSFRARGAMRPLEGNRVLRQCELVLAR